MPKTNTNPDFSGYVTKANIPCTDGRVIQPNAFQGDDGKKVPLVWKHGHDSTENILGHVILENRPDGVYGYGYFNNTPSGQRARTLIQHDDIDSMSIWAKSIVERSKKVFQGIIHEVSLVLSGANPGAKIDFVSFQHQDGALEDMEDEAIISFFEPIVHEVDRDEEDIEHEDDESEDDSDETVEEVFNTLSSKQKDAVYMLIAAAQEELGDEESDDNVEHSDNTEGETMTHNVFDQTDQRKSVHITHDHAAAIFALAKQKGSLRAALKEYNDGEFMHADEFQHSITNVDYMFPDARNVTKEPGFVQRDIGWVGPFLQGVRKLPFSRIRSIFADITADEARAKGYVTGDQKVEEIIEMLRRETLPQTIYKYQKMNRDDMLDITDFNVVTWLWSEMRIMMNEELARAALVSDGRSAVATDKIKVANVRPIYGDDAVYTYYKQVVLARTDDEMIDDLIMARTVNYKGTGMPTLYASPTQLANWLLLRDADGRRLYRTVAELAAEIRVKDIVEVPVMDSLSRDVGGGVMYDLKAVMVNPVDYAFGTDRGGEINTFDDFDLEYNQYRYLMETRVSGALVKPEAAVVLERAQV